MDTKTGDTRWSYYGDLLMLACELGMVTPEEAALTRMLKKKKGAA